jgi:hypothetical protein
MLPLRSGVGMYPSIGKFVDPRSDDPYGPAALARARSSGVEHLTFNQRVDGSIPSGLTIIFQ